MVFARADGDREGGAPLVVLALALAGVVVLDAVGRGAVAAAGLANGSHLEEDHHSAHGDDPEYHPEHPVSGDQEHQSQ